MNEKSIPVEQAPNDHDGFVDVARHVADYAIGINQKINDIKENVSDIDALGDEQEEVEALYAWSEGIAPELVNDLERELPKDPEYRDLGKK